MTCPPPRADAAAAAAAPQPPSDGALMARCRERDAAAFDALAARYREPLRRYVTALLVRQDPGAADDVLQDVLLRVWLRADTWDGRGPVKAWLFRVATNAALNHARTVARRRERPLAPGDPAAADAGGEQDDGRLPVWMADAGSPGPDAQALRADERRRVRRLVESLPEEKREVLRLVVDEEREVREVAGLLGIPEGTVKSRLFHARRQIARSWADENDEGDE